MRFYENPRKTSANRCKPRNYYIPKGLSNHISLNGVWNFKFFKSDYEYGLNKNIDKWDEIDVPSCWQLRGYESPNYANIAFPFPFNSPLVPDDNPCGVYERTIDLLLDNSSVYIIFEGVSSCAELFVNGQRVGFTQGSRLQAEFNITKFVNNGKNTIRVVVYKWCAGSYLEDQDHFRYNGIFRDCYILTRPKNHLNNIMIYPDAFGARIITDKQAEIKIYDRDGICVAIAQKSKDTYLKIKNPILWNAEKPYLYTAKISYNGEIIEQKIGLRTIGISSKGEFLINKIPVKLHGVNHHDTDKYKGWYQTLDDMRKDLLLMKKLNINCVRTSHYPPHPAFLNLCDELGFYVVLETDIETHGFSARIPVGDDMHIENNCWPCTRKDWKNEFIERMQRAAILNFNHPSVVIWSTGNESAFGCNQEAMIEWLHSLNDNRPAYAEDAGRAKKYDKVDIVSRMYPTFEQMDEYVKDKNWNKPFFLCEYSHAMGNGPGDVCKYNEYFDKYKKVIGGCIWEWADHVVTDKNGVERYGGDFEYEASNDGNFCCDGMVFADRTLKSGSYEIKYAYQPIKTKFKDGKLSVKNRLDFTNLNEYTFKYSIEVDETVIQERSLVLDVPPHKTVQIDIPYSAKSAEYGVYLNCDLIKDGYTYASVQHELPFHKKSIKTSNHPATITEDERNYIISGDNFEYQFSKHYGTFVSIKINGIERLYDKVSISTLRALTDNDMPSIADWYTTNIWLGEHMDSAVTKIKSIKLIGNIIKVSAGLGGVSRRPYLDYVLTAEFFADGRVDVKIDSRVAKETAELLRFGFDIPIKTDDYDFSYFGRGPRDNYSDLKNSSRFGMYKSNANDEYVNYPRPQEHGNHTGVRILNVAGLTFTAPNDFECCVSRYDTKTLHNARHTDELKYCKGLYVRVDYRSRGIGSMACGPGLDRKDTIREKKIVFAFSFAPEK